ncbi:ABC-type multidrug transport system fused ATPase/permease subunit [Mumia flava]|uniref:ABC-type multidrug transport system fused ATPase/permease subunit n=1 Tax=Mumia flava TaxID=1348852 RepID=A0A0B2B1I4_9ACTN|nr:ABC transporter ATP-binding protein [Mumia flava]PJJ58416.1 ABC-type multidrug transport system fused ATPase/permease subunit [Mumia flava]
MKNLPLTDPGTPDIRSAARYLLWILRSQGWVLVLAITFGVTWMLAQALVPAVLGSAIDAVVADGFDRALLGWTALLVVLGLVQAFAGITRHRLVVQMWLDSAYRTVQLVSAHAGRLGADLHRRLTHGEVVSVGATDIANIGNAVDVTARFAGSVVAYLAVAAILLRTSVTLGLVVLIGVPLLMLATGPLLGRLQQRNAQARALQGELNTLASDIVAGLRVLRGIGGEEMFSRRYRAASQDVRRAGVSVARVQSVLDALQVLLPGAFVVVVVWIGARFAAAGQITPGELVAFYGYATFLMLPLQTFTEAANKVIRGHVSARHVVRILGLKPARTEPDAPLSPTDGDVVDPRTGFVAARGRVTALVADDPTLPQQVADRIGGYVAPSVPLTEDLLTAPYDVAATYRQTPTYGGVPLDAIAYDELRRRIVVSDTGAVLFSGSLHDALDVGGRHDRDALLDAMRVAAATDVLDGLDDGLDSELTERGRSLSGGQRQRVVLARALLSEADVLVLVEPTSAVDAHTEARIAANLSHERAGRTTVVLTTSPLLLETADEVAFLSGGRVRATGSHRELMETVAGYRMVVARQEEDADVVA